MREKKYLFNTVFKRKAIHLSGSLDNGNKVDICCPLNKSGKSTISGIFSDAIYKYIEESPEKIITSDLISAETGNTIVVWAFEMNEIYIKMKDDSKPKDWACFMPLIIYLSNKDPNFAKNIDGITLSALLEGTLNSDINKDELGYLNDSLYYYGKRDYPNVVKTLDMAENLEDFIEGFSLKPSEKPKGKILKPKKESSPRNPRNSKNPIKDFKIDFDREFTEEELKRIPKMNLEEDIFIPDYVHKAAMKIKGELNGNSPIRNILWYGPAGTGKSFSTKILAQILNLPHYEFVFSKGIDEITLVSGAEVKDGTVTYNDSEIVKCVKNGGIIEFQEFFNTPASTLSFLNELLQEGRIRTANGEVITRNKNCFIVATSNIEYEGCQAIDFSTDDRFQLKPEIDDIDDKTLMQRIKFESGNEDEDLLIKIIKCYRDIKEVLEKEEWDEGIASIRMLISWAQDCKYEDVIDAAEETFLAGISKDKNKRKELIDNYLLHIF